MVSKATFYGVITVLVAAVLVSSSFTAAYYMRYQQQASQTERYIGELDSSLARYNSLTASYHASLVGYNRTISLLSSALANLNTSSVAYLQGSRELASLWKGYLELARENASAAVYSVDIFMKFGNGTSKWYNNTAVQPGWNAYVVTLVVVNGNLKAIWYPSYGEHFVTALGGVEDNPGDNRGWLLWTRNSTTGWQIASVGPDMIPMFDGSIIAWTYCSYDPTSYAPLCSP